MVERQLQPEPDRAPARQTETAAQGVKRSRFALEAEELQVGPRAGPWGPWQCGHQLEGPHCGSTEGREVRLHARAWKGVVNGQLCTGTLCCMPVASGAQMTGPWPWLHTPRHVTARFDLPLVLHCLPLVPSYFACFSAAAAVSVRTCMARLCAPRMLLSLLPPPPCSGHWSESCNRASPSSVTSRLRMVRRLRHQQAAQLLQRLQRLPPRRRQRRRALRPASR